MKSLLLPLLGALSSTGLAQEPSSAPTRFFVERVAIARGENLDLDTGGVFRAALAPSGVRSEIRAGQSGLEFLVERHLDDDPAEAAPELGDLPWYRVRTDRDRTAWVQVLREAPPPIVVRVVTRLGGAGGLRPSAGPAFCVGGDGAIDVHFRTHADYARYRVERRVGVEGELELAGETEGSPFVDDDAIAGERYRYRIVGVTRAGDHGIPVAVQGTTKSRGLFEGTCRLGSSTRGFDFLNEAVLERGGDIELTGTYGGNSAASFVDGWGIPVEASEDGDARPGAAGANGGWGAATGQLQMPPGSTFYVPLRGGGVARCRMTMPGDSWTAQLDYSVYPDGEWFPPQYPLEVSDEGDRVIVSIDAPPGLVLDGATRHDIVSGEVVDLEVDGGTVVDTAPLADALARYEATLVDRHGRVLGRSSAQLNRLPRGVRRGRFRFHYGQAYSIELGRSVAPDDGDVVFSGAAGGISSITLTARGGIANGFLDRRSAEGLASVDLFRALAEASPRGLDLRPSADGDSRSAPRDVFVLRTRNGGWARMAIVGRESGSSWNTSRATVVFAYNPHEPVFEEEVRRRLAVSGVVLDAEKLYGIDFEGFREEHLVTGALDVALGEGLDLETGAIAPGEGADVVFDTPRRGANALAHVRAQFGAVTLFLPHFGELRPDETALFDNLAMVESRALSLATEVTLLRDNPAARVVFLRTDEGAWVKLAVSDDDDREDRIRVRWALNPEGPVFLPRPHEAEEGPGFVLDRGRLLGLEPDPHRHDAVREGTVSLRPGEGWSFRDGAIVAAGDADLVLERASGDWAAAFFSAPAGVTALSELESWKGRPLTVEELFDAVVGARSERFAMEHETRPVVHEPASDVFVVRTAGGWAKVMVAARPRRGATDPALELRFQYCEGAAAFRPRPERIVVYGGLLLEPLH